MRTDSHSTARTVGEFVLSGGHPVLHQHRQRQPVPATHAHVGHRRNSRLAYGARRLVRRRAYDEAQQPAPTR
ncbi:hypothetical protein HEP87_50400 [Streptomyces sp. S1D4-11]|nr:hypothetical protein [Streptomyces sp. S1D4-11]QIZ00513.1 hypothetical protein HEP87_50400 [Streptomyces sp. S1D4-11]